MLKERLLKETRKLKKISEERDSYRTALQIMTKELNLSNLYQREGNSNADNQGDRHCNQKQNQEQVSDFQTAKSKKKKRKTQSSKRTQAQGAVDSSSPSPNEPAQDPTSDCTCVVIGDSIVKNLQGSRLGKAVDHRVVVKAFLEPR